MWTYIADEYEKQSQAHISCSACQLAIKCDISQNSASKAISFYTTGVIVSPLKMQGHGYSGVGIIYCMQIYHHVFIYDLYPYKPSLPLIGCVEELERIFGLSVKYSIIHRCFMTIGPFKGTTRVTSNSPNSRESW